LRGSVRNSSAQSLNKGAVPAGTAPFFFDPSSVVIGINGRTRVIDEITGVERCLDCLERARSLREVEEFRQVRAGARVREIQRSLLDSVVLFNKAQDTAEIKMVVVDVARFCVGGNDDERNAEAILIIAEWLRQNRWRLMVVPAAPIVPSNQDRSVVPIFLSVRACRVIANRVDYRCDPVRSSAGVRLGMIGVLAIGNDPAHLRQLASRDIRQSGPVHFPPVGASGTQMCWMALGAVQRLFESGV